MDTNVDVSKKKLEIRDWDPKRLEGFQGIEGWHCVEFFRKVREKMYKEENGLTCDEETAYIEEAKRNFEEKMAEWERKKNVNS